MPWRPWWQQCCIMQPCPDKPRSAEGRLCHFPECSDSMHCCWGATSWGALWVCLYACVSTGWGLSGSGMLGWVGTQSCVWDCVCVRQWKPSHSVLKAFIHGWSKSSGSLQGKKNWQKREEIFYRNVSSNLIFLTQKIIFLWRYIFSSFIWLIMSLPLNHPEKS